MPTASSRLALLTFVVAILTPSIRAQQPSDIRRVRNPVPNQYIVVLNADDDPRAVGLEAATIHRGRLVHVFEHAVHGFAMRMAPAAAAALARDPRVAYVEEDGVVHADLTDFGAPWGLDRIDQRLLPLDSAYSYPASIRQIRIHVLDTGVRVSHAEFGGRAFNAGDFVDDDRDWDPTDTGNDDANTGTPDGGDCNGHGTHVAATAAGATYGVARSATVMSYRVLDCGGSGTISSVLAGIDAVTADTFRPAVANMSLSGDVSDALDAGVRTSIAAGITYVVAAGNYAVDAGTQSPGRVPEAITVAATNASDARASFSNYGAAIDLFAPGVSIESAWYTSDAAAAILSGTSMATPHVTGVVAQYLEQLPLSSPASVRDALVNAATRGVISNPGSGSLNALLYSNVVAPVTPPTGSPLPAPWISADVGSVDVTGSAAYQTGTFTVTGSGADIWANADAFRFVYRSLSGDGTIVARVGSIQLVANWTKAAVMIRENLAPGAVNAAMVVSAARGLSFQRRLSPGGTSVATLTPGAAPAWIKLVRSGSTVSGFHSADGVVWTLVDTATVQMPSDVLVGVAVTSHYPGLLATASFTDVTVTATGSGAGTSYDSLDIGAVGVAGSTTANSDGSYTLRAAGADIWGTVDAFRYMYQSVSGDFDVEGRVDRLDLVHNWSKAGVMIRETLQPDSRHAFALVSAAKGVALQQRATQGDVSVQLALEAGAAPQWLRVSRRGSTLTAYRRTDSGSWQQIGATTLELPPSVYVGLAVTSHDPARTTTATISSFAVRYQ